MMTEPQKAMTSHLSYWLVESMGKNLREAIQAFIAEPSQANAAKMFTYHRESNSGTLDEVLDIIFVQYGFRRAYSVSEAGMD
jgi:hypothetical protein